MSSSKENNEYSGIEGFIEDIQCTVRECVDCSCLVPGGPTRCRRCAKDLVHMQDGKFSIVSIPGQDKDTIQCDICGVRPSEPVFKKGRVVGVVLNGFKEQHSNCESSEVRDLINKNFEIRTKIFKEIGIHPSVSIEDLRDNDGWYFCDGSLWVLFSEPGKKQLARSPDAKDFIKKEGLAFVSFVNEENEVVYWVVLDENKRQI